MEVEGQQLVLLGSAWPSVPWAAGHSGRGTVLAAWEREVEVFWALGWDFVRVCGRKPEEQINVLVVSGATAAWGWKNLAKWVNCWWLLKREFWLLPLPGTSAYGFLVFKVPHYLGNILCIWTQTAENSCLSWNFKRFLHRPCTATIQVVTKM